MKHRISDYVARAEAIASDQGLNPENSEFAKEILDLLSGMKSDTYGEANKLGFRDFLMHDFKALLEESGISSGSILEIGGPHNSFASQMPEYDFQFLSLYPEAGDDSVIVGDATQCDHVPSESFDAIFSVSVFEHISKPWKAASHISRLLKPGGVCYHAAPFSYFYHGAPADFWRYTPDAMQLIFSELRTLKAEFYGKNRRRDNRGSKTNPVDRDGGAPFAVDSFGGWRENWFAIYAGQKDLEYLSNKQDNAEKQVIVNLMKSLTAAGQDIDVAAEQVKSILASITVNHDAEIFKVDKGHGIQKSIDEIQHYWIKRGREAPKVNYARFAMASIVGIDTKQ